MQLIEAPKMSMKRKKNATDAVAAGFCWGVPGDPSGQHGALFSKA
jgi:hypothetical protein